MILIPNYATIIGTRDQRRSVNRIDRARFRENEIVSRLEKAESRFLDSGQVGSSFDSWKHELIIDLSLFPNDSSWPWISLVRFNLDFDRLRGFLSFYRKRFSKKAEKLRKNVGFFHEPSSFCLFFFLFFSKLCESSLLFLSLSPRTEVPPCENWGLTVYQQRREWQTQKTNERGTKGGKPGSRNSLLFFLFFLSVLPSRSLLLLPASTSSVVSFLSQFASSPPRTKVSQKKHLSSISVSTQTSHLFLSPFIGQPFGTTVSTGLSTSADKFETKGKENNGGRGFVEIHRAPFNNYFNFIPLFGRRLNGSPLLE